MNANNLCHIKPLPAWMFYRPMNDPEFIGAYSIGIFVGIVIGLVAGWAIWD